MQFKVVNLLCDMKLVRGDTVVIIRKGTEATVSAQEYQYLTQLYGMDFKGEKVAEVRITNPVEINVVAEEVSEKKKRKHKKVSANF